MASRQRYDFLLYGIFVAAILAAPLMLDEFWLNRIAKYLVFGMLGVAVALSWGYAGILNLGQGLFFGAGAYMLAMSLKLASPTSLQQGSDKPVPDFMLWNAEPGAPTRAVLHQQGLLPLASVSKPMVRRCHGHRVAGGDCRRITGMIVSVTGFPASSFRSSPWRWCCWCACSSSMRSR